MMTDGKSTIRILRQALGLTQTEFGRRVGMSIDEIKNLEYGNTRLKEIKIPLICQTYNVNETWLRTGDGEMFNPRQPKEGANMCDISDRIRQVRKSAGKTQEAFAASIGLKRSTVASYEARNTIPSSRTVLDMCRKYGISEIWLQTGEGGMYAETDRKAQLACFFGEVCASDDIRARITAALADLPVAYWEMLADVARKIVEESEKNKE